MGKGVAGFSHFAQIARSEVAAPQVVSALPETGSPVQQFSKIFTFQSYFDDVLLQKAILEQTRNDPIVQSTSSEVQMPGYAIGLHPSSQTPVAVQFKVGAQPTSSQPIILKPGQIVRPYGLPRGAASGAFSGFRWGLPFGWLGGGLATLLVFPTPDVDVSWPGSPELIFHRTRMVIVDAASLPANARKNWPLRFPWTQAIQGSAGISQQGTAQIAVEPTKIIMRLRLPSLANPATMRIVLQESNDFDLDSAGAVIAAQASYIDQIWASYVASGGAGNLGAQYPLVSVDDLIGIAADDGGICLQDMTGTLVGSFVDVVRYGRL